jgi:hypothetical protein
MAIALEPGDIPPPPPDFDNDGKSHPGKAQDTADVHAEQALNRAQQLETAVEAVDEGQRLLVDLDRRLNATREGMRALQRRLKTAEERRTAVQLPRRVLPPGYYAASATGGSGASPKLRARGGAMNEDAASEVRNNAAAPQWLLTVGGTFVRTTVGVARTKLELDVQELHEAISEARDELKASVCEVARLEGPDSALARLHTGFDLKPQ